MEIAPYKDIYKIYIPRVLLNIMFYILTRLIKIPTCGIIIIKVRVSTGRPVTQINSLHNVGRSFSLENRNVNYNFLPPGPSSDN